jgi:hypothetical protein
MPAPHSHFFRQYLGVVFASGMLVVLVAFISIPVSLGGHPGEALVSATAQDRHMT